MKICICGHNEDEHIDNNNCVICIDCKEFEEDNEVFPKEFRTKSFIEDLRKELKNI